MTQDRFQLVELFEPEAIKFTRRRNAQAWRQDLTTELYVLRETVLSKSKMLLSDGGEMHVFSLKNLDDPDAKLCSMEIAVRPSWSFSWDQENGKVAKKAVKSGCIGGVYTYEEHRGKGLAQIMIDKSVEVSKQAVVGPDGFMFLYSEVGDYYARCGFRSFNVPVIYIAIGGKKKELEGQKAKHDFRVDLIGYGGFEQYMDDYRKWSEANLEHKVALDHKTRVSVIPTASILDWFHLRAKFISNHYFHPEIKSFDYESGSYDTIVEHIHEFEPHCFGLSLTDEISGHCAGFVAWTYTWNQFGSTYESTIQIIKTFVYPTFDYKSTELELIERTIKYHQSLAGGTIKPLAAPKKIEIWSSEIEDSLLPQVQSKWDVTIKEINSSTSAIVMNNPSCEKKLKSDQLIWEDNTKLFWF